MLHRLSDTHGRGWEDGRLLASTLSFPEVQATQSTLGVGGKEGHRCYVKPGAYSCTKALKAQEVDCLQAPHSSQHVKQSREAPLVNKRETASTYHINTANQIHIFFSYIKDITVKKDCIYHHRPVFFRNFGK